MDRTLVTLAEVAVVAKGRRSAADVEAEARQLGMLVVDNWKGERCVSAADARSLVDGSAKATQQHEQAWARHVASEKRWVEDRGAAAREAADKVDAGHRGVRDGASWARANDAAIKAARKFERAHPRPRWPGLAEGKVAYP